MSLIPILSSKQNILITTGSSFSVSGCKKSAKKISDMKEVKFVIPAHDLSINGISIEEFKKFAQRF